MSKIKLINNKEPIINIIKNIDQVYIKKLTYKFDKKYNKNNKNNSFLHETLCCIKKIQFLKQWRLQISNYKK